MDKKIYEEQKRECILASTKNTKERKKAKELQETVKEAIMEYCDVCQYDINGASITNIEQLKEIKKVISALGEKFEMNATPTVDWYGATFTVSNVPESMHHLDDVINLIYNIRINYTFAKKHCWTYMLIRWFMREADLPEEFTRGGCKFKNIINNRSYSTRSFVCDGEY